MTTFVEWGLVGLTLLFLGSGDGPAKSLQISVEDSAEIKQLQAQLDELEKLLVALDKLANELTRLARNALKQADRAPTFEERARYEQLYIESSARLGELQATRDQLQRQMDELATRLRTFSGAE